MVSRQKNESNATLVSPGLLVHPPPHVVQCAKEKSHFWAFEAQSLEAIQDQMDAVKTSNASLCMACPVSCLIVIFVPISGFTHNMCPWVIAQKTPQLLRSPPMEQVPSALGWPRWGLAGAFVLPSSIAGACQGDILRRPNLPTPLFDTSTLGKKHLILGVFKTTPVTDLTLGRTPRPRPLRWSAFSGVSMVLFRC